MSEARDVRLEIDRIVGQVREAPALRAKGALRLVAGVLGRGDWLHGPGDDTAALPLDDGYLLVAGEAIYPPFVESDPLGAGIAAVLANVNDVAAMGGRPLAVVDTLVGPEPVAREALEGVRRASEVYGVPIVGGHLTVRDAAPALSAFIVGRASRLLSIRQAAPGQTLLLACCLEGRMRDDFPFFSSLEARGRRAADDVRLLAEVAERDLCAAARDVSMAGLLGSLAMLLEANRLGAWVDLDRLPGPAGVPLSRWLAAFPSFAFLLCAPEDRVDACCALFRSRDLTCEPVGRLDGSGRLRIFLGGAEAVLIDFAAESVTGLDGGAGA
ncbi:MAG TPA: AIR synthase related protein [Candidatus Dormibacteraeota bacterium]|nr:AIR synthase related protein [Candidatus Dormibacteraeota bacterium]